jgi:hypothetical protein
MKDYARAIIDPDVAQKQQSQQEGNSATSRRLNRRLQLGNVLAPSGAMVAKADESSIDRPERSGRSFRAFGW